MAYQISTALAIYFVIWWIALFLTLPFGVRSQHEDGEGEPGTDPGAPADPRLVRKGVITTLIATLLWIAFYLLATSDLISFRGN